MRHALLLAYSAKQRHEMSNFKVLTDNVNAQQQIFHSLLLTSTSPFVACFVNNKECEQEATIAKKSPFPKCLFSSNVFAVAAAVTGQTPYKGCCLFQTVEPQPRVLTSESPSKRRF